MIPASPTQHGIWFTERACRVDAAYHMPLAVHLDGDVDLPALRSAVATVLERHPVLGLAIAERDGVPYLVPAARPPELSEVDTALPFDLTTGPLFRCTLVHRPGGVTLRVVAHHLVFDGTSKEIFVRDLAAAYSGEDLPPVRRSAPGPDLLAAAREFWATHWRGDGDPPLPVVDDPTAALAPLDLPELAAPGATAFELLVAGWAAVLHRHGHDPAVIGVDLGTRTDGTDIGPFVTELPVRVGRAATFDELLTDVRTRLRELYPLRTVPLGRAVPGLPPRPSPTVTSVSYRRRGPTPEFTGLRTTVDWALPSDAIRATVQLQVVDGPDGRTANLQYRTAAVDPTTAERLAADLTTVLTTGTLSTVERTSHGPVRPIPDVAVSTLVSREDTGDTVAVVGADGSRLTYTELDAFAGRIATGLRGAGVGRGTLVGLCVRRTPAMVAAILGVWKAGAAYVPLDPDYPPHRLTHMLDDSGAALVITDRTTAVRVPDGPPRWYLEDTPAEVEHVPPVAAGDDLAYVTYTSGSTGPPKGVAVPHRALVNLLHAMRDLLEAGRHDRWLAQTSLSFDISGLELFLPLVTGGRVVVAEDPRQAGELIRTEHVTHVQATPSGWRLLLDAGAVRPDLTALTGGEALTPALAGELRPAVRRLVNLYGPTETTIWSTAWEVPPNPDRVSIGTPIHNTSVAVVGGELYIGGAGLATGYLGRPELTAERFPLGANGQRRYRTGDLVRWQGDELVFVGRADTQVKLRGHRIELGEIETRLAEHPEVVAAAAAVHGDDLVGYVQGTQETQDTVDPAGLRAFVAETLPAHAVPSRIVPITDWPTTPNGKLDRAALPAPAPVAPAPSGDGLAERIAGIWREVLRVDTLGQDDDLFDLGGHSLTITQIAARLRDRLGVDVPLDVFYDAPTVAELTPIVAKLRGDPAPGGPVPRPTGTAPPLSPGQERLWFLHQLDPDDAAYTLHIVGRLHGSLDVARFDLACTAVVARHEPLRTRFPDVAGRPVAVVEPPAPVLVEHLTATDAAEAHLLVAERVNAPLDLAAAPPVRFTLISLDEQDHVLCVVLHHIVADGWSLSVLLAELSAVYAGDTLPPLAVQHGDVAAWQQEQDREQDTVAARDYWRTQLADPPELLLPVANGPAGPGAFERRRLPLEVRTGLEEVARDNGATLFMVVLAAYQVLLAHHTGQRDILVGSPVAGRDRVELEPLVGYLTNTVLLRGDVRAGDSFATLLRRTRDTVLNAMAHQDVPMEQLLVDLGRPKLLETMCVLHTQETDHTTFADLRLEPFDAGYRQVKFDLVLDGWPTADGLLLAFGYDTSRLAQATVAGMADRFVTLLSGLVAAPDAPVVPVLTDGDHELLRSLAAGPESFSDTTVPERLAHAVETHADRPALVCGDVTLTYAELDARVARLAGSLQSDGVRPGDVVGVALPRSVDAVVTLLAVWRAGAAYLSLDPDLPAARHAYLVADSNATLVVDERYAVRDRPVEPVTPDRHDAAYVIYTSGSTGRPKGVVVDHGNLAARVDWMRTDYALTPADRIVQFASLSFDTHAEELYPALTAGATVILLPHGPTSLPAAWHDATVLDLPTAYFHRLEDPWPPHLRLLIIGGEQVHPAALARRPERCRLVNTYGPTETTIVATAADLTGEVHIGRPIAGTTAWVLDDHGRLVPPGAPGELAIGGAGVARGYLDRPDLTADRFVPDPWGPPGTRLYRTGDRVRWRSDGNLEFLGRLDDQLKVRGFRIEPGEVEAELLAGPGVREAAVTAVDETLVAYVVGAANHDDLAVGLAATLPAHLVPTRWVTLDALPLTVHGKVDRRALPAPERPTGHVPPRTDAEQLVADVVAEVLGLDRVGADDDFFELGGHSLLAVRVVSRLRATAEVDVPLRTLFDRRTVAGVAAAVEDQLLAELAGLSEEEALRQLEVT